MTLLRNEAIIIERHGGGSYVMGRYVANLPTIITAFANVQPIDGDDLLLLPEANRNMETLKWYSETGLMIDDILRRVSENVAQVSTCTVDNVVDSTDYTCTVNGTLFTYNSGIGATSLSIVAGLYALIYTAAAALLISIVDNLDGSYTITSIVAGRAVTIVVDNNQSTVEDIASISKKYKVLRDKNWMAHNIPHHKAYGYLVEE